jgi:hypothetical protein
VFVADFPNHRVKVQVSSGGGAMPVWSKNGHELFYRTVTSHILMVVGYQAEGQAFRSERAKPWSEKRLANMGSTRNFDLAPDGKRFLVLMPADGPAPTEGQSHVTLLANFFDEVRRRVPGKQ